MIPERSSMSDQERYKSFLLKAGYWAILGAIAVLFFRFLFRPLLPFLIAFGVSMILRPLVVRLTKKLKIKNSVIATVTVILSYLLLTALVAGIIIALAAAVINWAEGIPEYFVTSIYPELTNLGDSLMKIGLKLKIDETYMNSEVIPDIVSTISTSVMNFSGKLVTWASSVGTRIPSAFLTAVICIIATVFISTDYDNVSGKVFNVFPEKVQEALLFIRRAFRKIIGNYAKSYSLILLITFGEMLIGLLIIGYDNAFLYALAVAFFDILPVVGSGMILVPWIIITFVQGSIGRGIGLTILWLVVVVGRQYLEPRIVGKQVGLHPLATLVSMWLGLKLAGGVGLLAFPVLLLVFMDVREGGYLARSSDSESEEQPEQEPETE